ncbi:MAG: DUF2012 domain-containing protein [Oscillospiraceae bacterium]|nr:DUF2012 domain-containing protein [Oscillospiraceae bacterium]
MKKVFAVLLAVMLLVSSIATVSAADNPTFVLGKAAFANKGDTAVMTIEVKNFDSVSAIDFTVLYDGTKLELMNISDGSDGSLANLLPNAGKNDFAGATVSCVEQGRIEVAWDSISGYSVGLTGVILEFEFKALVDGPFVEKLGILTEGEDAPLLRKDKNEGKELEPFDFSVEEQVIGFNVSGTVTSYLDANEKVTVELYEEGNAEPSYSATVTGNSGTYSFSEVPSGTYTMKVSKKGHVTKEISVTVTDGDVKQDVTINLYGDVNSDGYINPKDATLILQYSAEFDVNPNLDAADVNGDSYVNPKDATLILQYSAELISKFPVETNG